MNNTATINHRELLKLFMVHMIDMEGSDYLGYHVTGCSSEMMQELYDISKEVHKFLEDRDKE